MKALNSPLLSYSKHKLRELNWFSTSALNLMKVGNAWSLLCKGCSKENQEKSSINNKKYLAPVVDRIGACPINPYVSRQRVRGSRLRQNKGTLWLFAYW